MNELITDTDIEQLDLQSATSRKKRNLYPCDLCQAQCEADRFFYFGMPICDKCQYQLLKNQGE